MIATKKNTRHCRDSLTPVPFRISVEMAFIPPDLSNSEYTEEVRKVIRKCLPLTQEDLAGPGLFEVYDPEVHRLIREVMQEN